MGEVASEGCSPSSLWAGVESPVVGAVRSGRPKPNIVSVRTRYLESSDVFGKWSFAAFARRRRRVRRRARQRAGERRAATLLRSPAGRCACRRIRVGNVMWKALCVESPVRKGVLRICPVTGFAVPL